MVLAPAPLKKHCPSAGRAGLLVGLAAALREFLDCPCQYFAPMTDDEPVTAALSYAQRLGVREGFTPVLVSVEEGLWEALLENTGAAVPGALGRGSLEFLLPQPVPEERALELAQEHCAFCVRLARHYASAARLADCLRRSRCWHFCWD